MRTYEGYPIGADFGVSTDQFGRYLFVELKDADNRKLRLKFNDSHDREFVLCMVDGLVRIAKQLHVRGQFEEDFCKRCPEEI